MAAARKSLPSSLVAADAEAGGAQPAEGGKGKGVPAEEMWLNGPFMAPLPPGPVVSVTEAAGAYELIINYLRITNYIED